jgi:N-acetylglutamate synthase-like GNAT family acetyltransferase
MSVRPAESDDADRITKVVESAMTASYSLSPREIENVAGEKFGAESVEEKIDADDVELLVAESDEDGVVVGVAEGEREDDRGVVRWLFVDPERRGRGHGTDLFERTAEGLRDRGAEDVRAVALSANREGGEFFERFGFEQVDEREVDIGGESVYEHVFAPEDAATEQSDADEDVEFPDDGTVTTDDGEFHVDREEHRSGTDGPFFTVYTDEDGDERYGYYCGNCGSIDTTMDEMERVECLDCGNVDKPDGSEQYDDGYL